MTEPAHTSKDSTQPSDAKVDQQEDAKVVTETGGQSEDTTDDNSKPGDESAENTLDQHTNVTMETEEEEDLRTPQEKVVRNIRQAKFGIGMTLSSEVQLLTSGLKELVGRSLQRLSNELYNKVN